MVDDPLMFIERLELSEGDIVTIHAEIDSVKFDETIKYLNSLKKRGIKIGVAINPKTSIEGLYEYLKYIDMILVMLINPGFAGQQIIGSILQKPIYVRQYLDSIGHKNIRISVDGGVSLDRAHLLAANGVDIFVGGTSGLFVKGQSLEKSVEQLRASIKIND